MDRQVSIGKDFFKNATRDYSNPVEAWVREIFQNCADAPGATEINFKVYNTEGRAVVSAMNNGAPMSQTTLTDVLLSLGGSFKGEESVGAFGRAKEILYFAQENYHILSGDWLVAGEGGSYKLLPNEEHFAGTASVVTTTYYAGDLAEAIRRLVRLSNWKGKVTLREGDGETSVLASRTEAGRTRMKWDWATVSTNKTGESHSLLVRVNGIPMFTRWCGYAKGTVVVELKGRSSETLISNRDGLKFPYSSHLNNLVDKVAVDKRTAFRLPDYDISTYTKKDFVVRAPRKQEQEAVEPVGVEIALAVASCLVAGTFNNRGTSLYEEEVEDDRGISVDHTFVIKNGLQCSTQRKYRRIPDRYLPFKKFGAYGRKLIQTWAKLLATFYELDGNTARFRVGFIFDEDILGEHSALREDDVDVALFLINPATFKEEKTYDYDKDEWKRSSQFKDRYKFIKHKHDIVAVAAHEYAHIAATYHNEDYALELTRVLALVSEHRNRLLQCFKQGNYK